MAKENNKEEPLKVNASFEEIIKASVSGNPAPKGKQYTFHEIFILSTHSKQSRINPAEQLVPPVDLLMVLGREKKVAV